jgi:hypothetical protein
MPRQISTRVKGKHFLIMFHYRMAPDFQIGRVLSIFRRVRFATTGLAGYRAVRGNFRSSRLIALKGAGNRIFDSGVTIEKT